MSGTQDSEGRGFAGWLVRLTAEAGHTLQLETVALDGTLPQTAVVRHARCVFSGVLHDRDDLTRAAGIELPESASDAEAVLNAYLRLGERFLEYVKGVFAIAIWNGEALFCARDRLGVFPLFRAEANGDVLVSTSVAALLAQPGVSRAVNLPALADHLRHRWPDAEETFFEAVHRIPPGHAFAAKNGSRRVFRYWDPSPLGQSMPWIREDELERFDLLLQKAVDRCVSAGETGVFLSGGLDSVSVAALADPSAGLRALSLAFPDPSCNEEDAQRAIASRLGLPQVMLGWDDAVGPEGLVAAALRLEGGLAGPLINLWSPAYDELARRGRKLGCRVILTGSGGDEWLGVTPYYAADLIRRLDPVGLARLIITGRRSYVVSSGAHLRNMLWRFGVRPLLRRGARRAVPGLLRARKRREVAGAIPAWLAPDAHLRRQIVERELEAYGRSLTPTRRLSRTDPVVYIAEMRLALDHPLVSMEMEETFAQGRRLGVSFLHPFLDPEVVEFLYRTPPELLNRGGRSKGLVRDAVSRRIPDLGLATQRKVVAAGFANEVTAREAPRAWREAGGVTALAEAGVVDPAAVDALVDSLAAGPPRRGHLKMWDLLSSETWLRHHGEGKL